MDFSPFFWGVEKELLGGRHFGFRPRHIYLTVWRLLNVLGLYLSQRFEEIKIKKKFCFVCKGITGIFFGGRKKNLFPCKPTASGRTRIATRQARRQILYKS